MPRGVKPEGENMEHRTPHITRHHPGHNVHSELEVLVSLAMAVGLSVLGAVLLLSVF